MLHNIKLLVAYDGTHYLGWQKTRMGPSIEETLENAAGQILQHKVRLQAASRTDAGVHADGQVVNFFTGKEVNTGKFRHGLNSLLPKDIVIKEVVEEQPNFHPTLDCTEKEYRYSLCFGPFQHPKERLYSWHFPNPLDLALMRNASTALIGSHDFSAFCNVKKNSCYETTVRKVYGISIVDTKGDRVEIIIRGSNFLYKMVRNIVGTLAYVGCGKLPGDSIPRILAGLDRTEAGITAPAHGLTLQVVYYSSQLTS